MSVPRTLVALLGLALLLAGAALLFAGRHAAGLYLLFLGAVVLLGTVFERWRYRAILTRASPGWQRTDERFVAPDTGKRVTVFYDPASGERHYVGEDGSVQDQPRNSR
jgi:hypothetical protein